MFDKLWDEVIKRSDGRFPVVQDKEELRHIFNLMQGCKSYLEVGTAEGNSLYVLKHAVEPNGIIEIVDLGEEHTTARNEIMGHRVIPHYGNSHDVRIVNEVGMNSFDIVLIDAGHEFEDVVADAIAYGRLARKYIFFHDIQLSPVKAAFDWYCRANPQFKVSTFINSEKFGYGILEK